MSFLFLFVYSTFQTLRNHLQTIIKQILTNFITNKLTENIEKPFLLTSQNKGVFGIDSVTLRTILT